MHLAFGQQSCLWTGRHSDENDVGGHDEASSHVLNGLDLPPKPWGEHPSACCERRAYDSQNQTTYFYEKSAAVACDQRRENGQIAVRPLTMSQSEDAHALALF